MSDLSLWLPIIAGVIAVAYGVFTTHFSKDPFDMVLAIGSFCSLTMNGEADFHASCESNNSDLRMANQNRANFFPNAWQVVQNISGNAGLMKYFYQ